MESAPAHDYPFPPPKATRFRFVDLFAGIGGFRLAMQRTGGCCVFSSEWDKPAQETYFANFGEIPFGDITKIANEKRFSSEIPKHDILTGGFPCQAFSIAGFKGGFSDTRGTLFFNLARIIEDHAPKAFFLENVKGLASHDRGRTFTTILRVLEEDLGYHVQAQIVNAKDFGVPQNRERVFMVGFNSRAAAARFEFPKPLGKVATIADIKEAEVVSTKYYLSDRYLETLIRHRDRHESKGNGFGFEIKKDSEIASALVVGGMGRERNLVVDKRLRDFTPKTNIKGPVNRQGIRKMTPREWARLQGFPDSFVIPVSDAQAYKQFGNSVSVPAVEATVKRIVKALGL
jgi:DNA (cytosine-5)-methyltransferase 1